jgi:hypothetical protein
MNFRCWASSGYLSATHNMAHRKQRSSYRKIRRPKFAPNSGQMTFMLSVLGLTARALEYAFGISPGVIAGRIPPTLEEAKILWRIWNMRHVQKSLQGVLRITVVSPSSLYSKQRKGKL